MEREIIITDDGSSSIFVSKLGEHYHSHFGAIQESMHIFINSGLSIFNFSEINVLEFGFGTGLNALLTYKYALENDKMIKYTTWEKYPLLPLEYKMLNYESKTELEFFNKIHEAEAEKQIIIEPNFELIKHLKDFRMFISKPQTYDIVYFDAFSPDVQPHLWTEELFTEIYNSLKNNGIFITYTVKGSVRRSLKNVGFEVEKIPGPVGKREICRAWKK